MHSLRIPNSAFRIPSSQSAYGIGTAIDCFGGLVPNTVQPEVFFRRRSPVGAQPWPVLALPRTRSLGVVTLARYPAALSVSTLHASSSRRDKGQLNETVRGVFGSGHLGGGRAAWGLVTLGICIPIQPMTPAWARS